MIRISSIAIFLLISSVLVSCSQPTTPAPSVTPDFEPTQTIATAPPTHTPTLTLAHTPIHTPDVSSAPIVGALDGVIEFAGRKWNVKSGCGLGPGPNCWSDSAESVWVQGGQLHLKLRKIEGRWHSAEVSSVECTQYGIHRFFVSTELNSLDKNLVAALFLYKDDQHEIDIEFSKWAEENAGENAQYVVQPWEITGNLYKFTIPPGLTESTHSINWNPSSIQFQSIQGLHQEAPPASTLLDEWEYSGNDIPAEADCLRVHINLWQVGGSPPSDEQEAVMVVTGADLPDPYQPPPTPVPPTPNPATGPGGTPRIEITTAEANYLSGMVQPDSFCNDNYRIVIYAKTDIWYVQPFTASPHTVISVESCNWESLTHPWDELAVFLVPENYDPPETLSSQPCPPDLPGTGSLASVCIGP